MLSTLWMELIQMNSITNSYQIFITTVPIMMNNPSKKCVLITGYIQKKFLAIHFNARSAPKNLSSVENYLKYLNFDFTIIRLTETWFDDHNVHLYNIPGYKQEHYVRPTQGGGVSIMVAESVMYKRRTGLEICNENIETIFIETDKKCHLTGDYNINILQSDDHGDTSDFLDTMHSHAYVPLTKSPPESLRDQLHWLITSIAIVLTNVIFYRVYCSLIFLITFQCLL